MGATHHARSSREHERGAASHVLYRGRPLRHWLTIRLAEAVDICASAHRVCVRAIRRLYSNISYSAALERAALQALYRLRAGRDSQTAWHDEYELFRDARYYLGEEKIDPDFPQQQNGLEGHWTPAGGLLSTVPYRQVKLSVIGRKSGKTISIPVWFVLEGEKLFLLPVQGPETQWYKNVLKNPSIRIDARGVDAEFRASPATGANTVKSVMRSFERSTERKT
jgi:hypothetical protein